MIIIINGSGGVGKDQFVKYCRDSCHERNIDKYVNIHNISTVTAIKEIAEMAGWSGGKSEKDRKFLSDLKMLCSEYNDFPHQKVLNELDWINKNFYSKRNIIFIHCREPEEIQRFVEECNAATLLIRRPNYHINSNAADRYVENFNYDYIIENDGTLEELKDKAALFLEHIL